MKLTSTSKISLTTLRDGLGSDDPFARSRENYQIIKKEKFFFFEKFPSNGSSQWMLKGTIGHIKQKPVNLAVNLTKLNDTCVAMQEAQS